MTEHPTDRPASAAERPTRGKRIARSLREWVVALLLALVILTPVRSSIADWNDVPSGSMEPTILVGDRILVNKLAYGLRVPLTGVWLARWDHPAPGEIVILHSPVDGTRLVKRVIAGPGDVLELRGGVVLVNGMPATYAPPAPGEGDALPAERRNQHRFAQETLLGSSAGGTGLPHAVMATPAIAGRGSARDFGPVTVPPGSYFVMGDNRDMSADSRAFGFVPERSIVGRSGRVALSVDPSNSYRPRWSRFLGPLR